MKKLVKIFVVAAFAFGFGVTAQAQTRNATLEASATVRDQLAVTKQFDLAFGVAMQGASKRIDAAGAVTSSDGQTVSGSDTSVGRFLVNAGAGSSVTINIAAPAVLSKGEGESLKTMPIFFNKALDGIADATNVGYGTEGTSIERLEVNSPNPITTFPDSVIGDKVGTIVYIGGTIIPSATQENGIYTGTITLTATYN
jgi:hypothetical protein